MPFSDERHNLMPAEQRFIQRVAKDYTPQPFSAAQQATFDRRLAERLADAPRRPFLRPAGLLAATCAALLLWFALPSQQVSSPDFTARPVPSLAREAAVTDTADTQALSSPATLLAYAYYQSETQDDLLPDEYLALAEAFELL